MKIAADAELRQVDLVCSEDFARAADGVVFRMVEIVDVVCVHSNFRREEFRVESKIFGAGVAVEPSEVGESEGFGFGRGLRGGWPSCEG